MRDEQTNVSNNRLEQERLWIHPDSKTLRMPDWKIVYAGSRFTTDAEQRYAPIEGEAMALLFALDSCRMFVMRCSNLIFAVDHKPLTRCFNNRDLHDIKNPRLLKIKEKTLMYQFKIISIPGSDNNRAEALSRIPYPPHKPTTAGSDIEQSIIAHTQTSFENEPPAVNLREIKDASLRDNQYQLLVYYIINGFPENKHNLDESLRPFWNIRHDICTVDSLVYLNQHVLIPNSLRKISVEQLHIGHQGVNSMRANAS